MAQLVRRVCDPANRADLSASAFHAGSAATVFGLGDRRLRPRCEAHGADGGEDAGIHCGCLSDRSADRDDAGELASAG